MFFDTPIYFVFLSLVVVVYWRLGRVGQNRMLLAASYFFYGWWDWRFLGLIATSTVVDFYCARAIERATAPRQRRWLLAAAVSVNLTFLGFFKYFDFFTDSLVRLLATLGIEGIHPTLLRVVLPPGISFYTFQELAYIADVYKRRLKPAESLVDYALFVSLFPHLIAGPIQHPSHLLPQVQRPRRLDWDAFFDGLMLIASGLFRKCVVANRCALVANAAFSGRLGEPNLAVLLLGMYAFAWQIYGDFSGYSDIARGSAQLMGFHFMVNFRQPYLAESLQAFWRRWHISLSTWLRDYLYIPLGGNRHGTARTYCNLIVTMLLGGLWHGANWTFVIWGGIHGVGLAVERMLGIGRSVEDGRARLFGAAAWARRAVVFHLVCLAWVFFRADSLGAALAFLGGLPVLTWRPEYLVALKFLALVIVPLAVIDLFNEVRHEEYLFEAVPAWRRLAVATGFLVMLTGFSGNELNAFIYFQF
jgi:D-alanyl-lipoteichoic acid acyltransferase DltB (MBOAT superfamily)